MFTYLVMPHLSIREVNLLETRQIEDGPSFPFQSNMNMLTIKLITQV